MVDELAIIQPDFYARNTTTVAQELLGKYLVLEIQGHIKIGRITETEAYLGLGDKGSHSNKGLTKRTEVLFGPPGIAYVYLVYGMYHCFNIVTHIPESGAAVLIRAVEPIQNIEGKTSGPGLVCKAFGIDRSYNGLPVYRGPLTIRVDPKAPLPSYTSASRVGIDYAGKDAHLPLRFRIA